MGSININMHNYYSSTMNDALYSKKSGANRAFTVERGKTKIPGAVSNPSFVTGSDASNAAASAAKARAQFEKDHAASNRRAMERNLQQAKERQEHMTQINAQAKERSENNTQKKEVKYNHKAYTRKIMQSKTPENAKMVATQIRSKINELYQMLNSGEYDTEEVMSCIAHAEAMEQAALQRSDNLRLEREAEKKAKSGEEGGVGPVLESEGSEEDLQKQIEEDIKKEIDEEMKAMLQELQEEMQEMMDEMEEMESFYDALDELSDVMSGDIDPEDVEEMKKRHRAEENGMINLADMAYLKSKFDRLQAQKDAIKTGGAAAVAGFSAASAQVSAPTISLVSHAPSVSVPASSAGFSAVSSPSASVSAPSSAAPSAGIDVSG